MPNWFHTPLVPQSWVDAVNQWAQPGKDTSPGVAALKGLGAGMFEAAQPMTTPTDIAIMAVPELLPMGRGLEAVRAMKAARPEVEAALAGLKGTKAIPEVLESIPEARGLADFARPSAQKTMNRMYEQANPVFKELEATGMFGGPRTTSNIGLARPKPVARATETLGELSPEFTSVGGEGLYNAGRPMTKAPDVLESAYKSVLKKGGR